jgi:flagellar basal body-associated protein FliL
MEGGIAILLLVIIVVVAGGIGIALYITGGTLTLGRKTAGRDEHRPEHKEATSPELEHTEMVGADKAVEDSS